MTFSDTFGSTTQVVGSAALDSGGGGRSDDVHSTAAGTHVITAAYTLSNTQSWSPSSSSTGATINVSAESQTITFTGLPTTATYGSAGPYALNATASSGLAVTYAVTGPARLSGSTLTITGAGTVVVTASQAGKANYAAATAVSHTITVSAANVSTTPQVTYTGRSTVVAPGCTALRSPSRTLAARRSPVQ